TRSADRAARCARRADQRPQCRAPLCDRAAARALVAGRGASRWRGAVQRGGGQSRPVSRAAEEIRMTLHSNKWSGPVAVPPPADAQAAFGLSDAYQATKFAIFSR